MQSNAKQFEVCVNTSACQKAKYDEQFPIGTYICPECSDDLETRDTRSGWQKFGSKTGLNKVIPAIFGGTQATQGSIVVSGTAGSAADAADAVATLAIQIVGVGTTLFEKVNPDLVIEHVYHWGDQNVVRPAFVSNMTGGLENDEITIGAANPWSDWRQTLDVSAICAQNVNIGSDGKRQVVTASQHMATVKRNDMGEIIFVGTRTKNGPRLMPEVAPFVANERLQANEVAVIEHNSLWMMGDILFRFLIT